MSDGGISARRAVLLGLAAAPAEAREADDSTARRAAFVAEERARAEPPAAETLAYQVTPAAVSAAVWGKPKSLAIAYALWLVLGLAGAHRFYLGRYVSGALQATLGLGSWGLLAAEYYPAFAGMALALAWMSADAYFVRRMHARPPR